MKRTPVGNTSDGRTIWEYERRKASARTRAGKRGVDKRRGKPLSRKILVIGTGRSGSKTITHQLRKAGLDVGHEHCRSEGTSTHYFHTDHKWYPYFPWTDKGIDRKAHLGERMSDYKFENIVHVVRNPLVCIPSISRVHTEMDYEFLEDLKLIPMGLKGGLLKAMHYWLSVNKAIEENLAPHLRIKLENLDKEWPKIMRLVGIENTKIPMPDKRMNKTSGYRKYDPITKQDILDEDWAIGKEIVSLAKKYGYKL